MYDRTNAAAPTPEEAIYLLGIIELIAPDVMRRAVEALQRRRARRQAFALHIEAAASTRHDGGQR